MTNKIIWPEDLNDLTDQQLLMELEEIRTRREKISAYLKTAKKLSQGLSEGTLKLHIEKELLKFTKAFEKADKAITEIEKRLSNITALRLQLEDAK